MSRPYQITEREVDSLFRESAYVKFLVALDECRNQLLHQLNENDTEHISSKTIGRVAAYTEILTLLGWERIRNTPALQDVLSMPEFNAGE